MKANRLPSTERTTRAEEAAAARAEEGGSRLGGESLGRAVLLDRHEVEEDRAHRA